MTRQEALESGAIHYHGKPCRSCGQTLKFVTGYSCVACVTKRTAERNSDVYRKYATSAKGKERAQRFRKTDTHKKTQNKYNRKKYAQNPRSMRNRAYLNRYGIGIDDVDAMSEQQNHRCGICNKHKDEVPHKRLVVDHCHDTNKIRKLLCGNCNVALGMVNEDVDILIKMAEYVRAFKGNIINDDALDY